MQRRAFLATAAIALALATATPVLADDGAEAVVEAYLAAWNAHDSAAAAAFFAPDVVYYDASVGTPIEGRDAAKTGVIDNFLTAVPDASWKMKGAPV
ncbi:MAG: nuclear transport factor 2 family protein, partial [Rhodobacteraceae bacterium]|nr:nuclear transport factor 2 family protein [Paracoccaceae bacterium]